jgi:hypothetical protein
MRSDYFLASIVVLINCVYTESLYERGGTCTDSGMLRVNVRLVCGKWMYSRPPKLSLRTIAAKSLCVIYANKSSYVLHFPLSSTHARINSRFRLHPAQITLMCA